MRNSLSSLMILVLILSLVLIGCGNTSDTNSTGSLHASVESKESSNESTSGMTSESTTETEEESTENLNQSEDIKTVDPSKEIVFDFVYEPAEQLPVFTSSEGNENDFNKAVRLPQINLDSEDAKRFNQEVVDFINLQIVYYKMAVENNYDFGVVIGYDYTVNGEVVSITLNSELGSGEFYSSSTSSFNFNSKTGKEIANDELIKMYGLEKDIISLISAKYWGIYQNILQSDLFEGKELLGVSLAKTWTAFYGLEPFMNIDVSEEIKGTLRYMPDSYGTAGFDALYLTVNTSNQLCLVSSVYASRGGAEVNVVEPLVSNGASSQGFVEYEIDGIYRKVAEKMGIDPESAQAPMAFATCLGYEGQGDELIEKLAYLVKNIQMDKNDMMPIDTGSTYSSGKELYLVIPKYKETATIFNAYHYFDEGAPAEGSTDGGGNSGSDEMYQGHDKYYIGRSALGPFIVVTEATEFRPKLNARIQYLDQYAEVDFALSGRTGELENDHTVDISELLDEFVKDGSGPGDYARGIAQSYIQELLYSTHGME